MCIYKANVSVYAVYMQTKCIQLDFTTLLEIKWRCSSCCWWPVGRKMSGMVGVHFYQHFCAGAFCICFWSNYRRGFWVKWSDTLLPTHSFSLFKVCSLNFAKHSTTAKIMIDDCVKNDEELSCTLDIHFDQVVFFFWKRFCYECWKLYKLWGQCWFR